MTRCPLRHTQWPPPSSSTRPTHTPQQHNDRELVARLQANDVSAFDAIVLLYSDRLEEYVRRMVHDADLTEDIIQDVFVRIWERRAQLDLRGTLQSYLYASVRNQTLDLLRRMQLEEDSAEDFLVHAMTPGTGATLPAPDAALERQELAHALARALDSLSPRVRQVALLRWRDKMSRPEIAAVLGVSVPTVSNQLTTAARALRTLLAEYPPTWRPDQGTAPK